MKDRTGNAESDGAGSPQLDAADELSALAHALVAHTRRARLRGRRSSPVASSSSPVGARSSSAKTPSPGEQPSARVEPRAGPGPARTPAQPSDTARRAASLAAQARAGAEPARSSSLPPARSPEDVRDQARAANDLATLRAGVAQCEACNLCRTRTQTVFMDGHGARRVLFVGEAPGADEDRTGVPFVGRAGQLLTDIITKGMGLARDEVWIANVLKCRPPDNRDPTPAEKATCTPWLDRQIELLDPQVIIPLGRHAAMHILKVEASMGAMRQRIHTVGGRKVVPTYHPSYLLRSPGEKKECWKDIQLAMGILGLVPKRSPST